MIQTAPESFVTRPPRIQLEDSHCARVSLWRDGEAESGECPAEMIDISSGGTKLRVTTCLRFEESVRLRIEIPSVDLNCYVLASVRHIRPAGEGRWIVGCAVYPPLDEKAVARLAMQSGCDRRRWQRESITLPVSVRRQLALIDSAATIVNLSTGGFCILLAESCTAGECIRVGIRDSSGSEYTVLARAQWQMKTAEGFLLGCKFMRADDYEVLQAATGAPDKRTKPDQQDSSLWPAAALLACAPIAMVVLLETNWDSPVGPPLSPPAQQAPDSVASGTTDRPAGDETPPYIAAPDREQDIAETPVAQDTAQDLTPQTPSRPEDPPPGEAPAVLDPVLPEEVPPEPAPREVPKLEMREWTDSTGQFRVTAVLVAVEGDGVRLRRSDGREVVVPLAKLSAADAQYVRGLGLSEHLTTSDVQHE